MIYEGKSPWCMENLLHGETDLANNVLLECNLWKRIIRIIHIFIVNVDKECSYEHFKPLTMSVSQKFEIWQTFWSEEFSMSAIVPLIVNPRWNSFGLIMRQKFLYRYLPLNFQANDVLLGGRKLTALEAHHIGLVSQVFWPTSLMQEVVPRIQNMASFSSKVF